MKSKKQNELAESNKNEITTDTLLDYEALGISLPYNKIICPFVFIPVHEPENVNGILINNSNANPYLNACTDSFRVMASHGGKEICNTKGAFDYTLVSGLRNLYVDYGADLIVTNAISLFNAGFIGAIRHYSMPSQAKDVDTLFQQAVMEIKIRVSDEIFTMLNDYIPNLSEYIYENKETIANTGMISSKGEAGAEFVAGMIGMPIIYITRVCVELLNAVFAGNCINYNEAYAGMENTLPGIPYVDDNVKFMIVHRNLTSLMNDDLAKLGEIIEMVAVNIIDKINVDIINNFDSIVNFYHIDKKHNNSKTPLSLPPVDGVTTIEF